MAEVKEKEMNVWQKVAKARVMLQQKSLKKSGENKFAGYKYFELSDFLPSVNEIFAELGLCAHFYIESEEVTNVSPSGEAPYYVTTPSIAYLDIIDSTHPSQNMQFSSVIAEAGTKGTPIQQLGSVHTYMRRYLYLEAMEISECDGIDGLDQSQKVEPANPPKKKPAKEEKPAVISEEQIMTIVDLFNGDEARMQKMMNVYQVERLDQLNAKQAENIIKRLERDK